MASRRAQRLQMRRRATLAIVGVIAVVLTAAAPAEAQRAGAPGGGLGSSGGFGIGPAHGLFVVVCGVSHTNHDDMIVYPGQPGHSHDHTYFGNNSTNASSTVASLQASDSTCSARGDRAAYWVPTLTVDGSAVQPLGAAVYYVRRTTATVEPFPAGFRMIAGDATAQTGQSLDVTSWSCAPFGSTTSGVPTCRLPALVLRVRFPDCWDGTHLDVADHKSHMAYSSGGACPAGHPVALPGLQLVVLYPTSGGPRAELSSGGSFSSHADFVNAWDQQLLTQRVNRDLNHTQASTRTVV